MTKIIGTIPDKAGTIPDKAGTIPDKVGTIPDKAGTIPDKIGTIPDKIGTIPDYLHSRLVMLQTMQIFVWNSAKIFGHIPDNEKVCPE